MVPLSTPSCYFLFRHGSVTWTWLCLIESLLSTKAEEQGPWGRCIAVNRKRNFIFITSFSWSPSGGDAWRSLEKQHGYANSIEISQLTFRKPVETELWNVPTQKPWPSLMECVFSLLHSFTSKTGITSRSYTRFPDCHNTPINYLLPLHTGVFLMTLWVSVCMGNLADVCCVFFSSCYDYGTHTFCRLISFLYRDFCDWFKILWVHWLHPFYLFWPWFIPLPNERLTLGYWAHLLLSQQSPSLPK